MTADEDHLIDLVKQRRPRAKIERALQEHLMRSPDKYAARQRLIKAFQEKAPDLLTPGVQDLLEGRKS